MVALSPNSDNNYLAYLASSVSGEILVFDALNLQVRKRRVPGDEGCVLVPLSQSRAPP